MGVTSLNLVFLFSAYRFLPFFVLFLIPNSRLFTVLVYFNDDFEGGETRFQEQIERTIIPKRGMVAIFQHKVRHEGCPVRRGIKYAMRSDVIYEAGEPISKVG